MKTMYQGGLYGVDITRADLTKLIAPSDGINAVEQKLRTWAIDYDQFPQMYEASEDESRADVKFPSYMVVEPVPGGYTIACTVLEKYTVFDDGSFYDGSDYDWSYCMSQDAYDALMADLFE